MNVAFRGDPTLLSPVQFRHVSVSSCESWRGELPRKWMGWLRCRRYAPCHHVRRHVESLLVAHAPRLRFSSPWSDESERGPGPQHDLAFPLAPVSLPHPAPSHPPVASRPNPQLSSSTTLCGEA